MYAPQLAPGTVLKRKVRQSFIKPGNRAHRERTQLDGVPDRIREDVVERSRKMSMQQVMRDKAANLPALIFQGLRAGLTPQELNDTVG